jgi:hypothetical protein
MCFLLLLEPVIEYSFLHDFGWIKEVFLGEKVNV